MDLSFTAEEEAFRTELRSYLESTLPAEWSRPGFWDSVDRHEAFALRRNWEAEKAKAGFAGIAWPKEWGGRGGTEGMKAIYDEEMVLARAPRTVNPLGLSFLAPTVMAIGTDHPPTHNDHTPIGWWRYALGLASLTISIFCLAPIPISMG